MNSARRHSRHPRSATGVGVGRVNGAKASGFDADGINRKTILFFTGFPSKLENDGKKNTASPPRPGHSLVNFSFEGR